MITAWCCAIAVVALGAALRPRPVARRPGAERPTGADPNERVRQPLRRRRRARPVEAGDVAVWCEQLARSARAGETLSSAIRSTAVPAALEDDLAGVRLALDRGASLTEAVEVPVTSPHLSLAFAVVRACAANGGPAAEPLDRAAATLRARAADRADRATQSAQARLSAVVMTLLPIGMLGLLLATSASTRTAVGTPAGTLAVALGGSLNLIGWRWMRRIVAGGDR